MATKGHLRSIVQAIAMSDLDPVIVVIDDSEDHSDKLKELLEFMDARNVCTASPKDWQVQIGEHRLAAVFVCDRLDEDSVAAVIDNVGKMDPNVPVVLVSGESHA